MAVVVTVGQIGGLLFLMKTQNIVIPVIGRFRVQVVKYFPIRAGNRAVKNFLDEIRVAFIGLGDIRGSVCIL